jgi:molybdate transport system substrate-binding protein
MSKSARVALLAASVPAFILLSAQTVAAQNTEIRIMCSNGFRAAMEKLLPQAEHTSGHPVKVQFGASANFKRSIEGGEPFDLLIVTPQIVADLIKEGKLASGTEMDLASTGIGIATRAALPKPDVSTAQAVKQMLLDAKSIGYVKVGAGTPAVLDMFNRLGISENVQGKTVFQPGADQSMASVANGQTDVAFGLISEIVSVPGVQLAGPVPSEFQRRIILTAGIASSTKNREAVQEIVKSLTSAAAAATIKAAGLDPIAKDK